MLARTSRSSGRSTSRTATDRDTRHVTPMQTSRLNILAVLAVDSDLAGEVTDANLGPVRDATSTVEQTVQPLAGKRPGEAITAADWNALAGNVAAVANAVSQLTRLVTPVGHNHRELEDKINEIQGNFTTL